MFGVCKPENGDVDDNVILPKPPPPPPRRPSNTRNDWFPGKFLSQAASAAREKIDELPSLSSHNTEPEPNNEVSRLFPNTTSSIAKERNMKTQANSKEFDQIEKWWIAQLFSEADDEEQQNMLAKGKPAQLQPLPSDARWAFEARIMHPACSGTLRIILHFVTEFLANDVVNVVSHGELGHWTLPSLIHAFIHQIENILADHPLWRAEYSTFIPFDVRDRHMNKEGAPLTPKQEQNIKVLSAAWESTCDELENFIFRKIGAVLLPSKGPPEKLTLPPVPTRARFSGYGYGQTGSRPEQSEVVYQHLCSMRWVRSADLGVAWGGLDLPKMWAPAATELAAMGRCHTPSEMLGCLVRCFAQVSATLVLLLEEVRLRDLDHSSPEVKPSPMKQALLSASPSFVDRPSMAASELHRPTFTGDDVDMTRWSFESKDFGPSTPFANLPCADDVLPAVILVLLQSNPRHLLAYLDFALAFRSKSRLSSEGHYFIITLTSAVHFILDIEPEQLGLTEEEFQQRSASARARSALEREGVEEGPPPQEGMFAMQLLADEAVQVKAQEQETAGPADEGQ